MIFPICDSRSHKKFVPSLLFGLSVSIATGTKMYFGISSRYFSTLRLAACSAAAPAVFDVPKTLRLVACSAAAPAVFDVPKTLRLAACSAAAPAVFDVPKTLRLVACSAAAPAVFDVQDVRRLGRLANSNPRGGIFLLAMPFS